MGTIDFGSRSICLAMRVAPPGRDKGDMGDSGLPSSDRHLTAFQTVSARLVLHFPASMGFVENSAVSFSCWCLKRGDASGGPEGNRARASVLTFFRLRHLLLRD